MNYKNKFVITNMDYENRNLMVQMLLDEQRKAVECNVVASEEISLIGNIYIARVINIVKNINAAFLEIAPNQKVFCSLEEDIPFIYTKNQNAKEPLCIGDEIVVQVIRDGIKTKFPIVTGNISFESEHLVLTSGNTLKGVSRKITGENRMRLKSFIQELDCPYGLVVRTNAALCEIECLKEEQKELQNRYEAFLSQVIHKSCYTLLSKGKPFYMDLLAKLSTDEIEEIVTDQKDIYDDMIAFCSANENMKKWISYINLYQDDYGLHKLYSLNTQLEKALNKNVWLPSGAYLVIEPTEALTVIDVNSGKNTKVRKDHKEFYEINVEASKEIARQLRLRNISGMVLIDFINMDTKEEDEQLLMTLRALTKEDPIKVNVHDMTKLGLVEVTREKTRKSLQQQIYGYQ